MSVDGVDQALDGSLATSLSLSNRPRAPRGVARLQLVEGQSDTIDLDGFASAGHCERAPVAGAHREFHMRWNAPFLEPDWRSARRDRRRKSAFG